MSENIKIWRYSIPNEDGGWGWGIFLLDSTGMFCAVTDYGNYAYKWGNTGRDDFRKFMIGVVKSPSYLLEKVAKKVYSAELTLALIKESVLEYRRDQSWSKELAREEWDLIDNCDWLEDEACFVRWHDLTSMRNAGEYYREDYNNDAWAFAKCLMSRLVEVLSKELEEEE